MFLKNKNIIFKITEYAALMDANNTLAGFYVSSGF